MKRHLAFGRRWHRRFRFSFYWFELVLNWHHFQRSRSKIAMPLHSYARTHFLVKYTIWKQKTRPNKRQRNKNAKTERNHVVYASGGSNGNDNDTNRVFIIFFVSANRPIYSIRMEMKSFLWIFMRVCSLSKWNIDSSRMRRCRRRHRRRASIPIMMTVSITSTVIPGRFIFIKKKKKKLGLRGKAAYDCCRICTQCENSMRKNTMKWIFVAQLIKILVSHFAACTNWQMEILSLKWWM